MPDGAAPVLDVRGLKTVFRTRGGEVHAVNSVSFHLERGELLGVVGLDSCVHLHRVLNGVREAGAAVGGPYELVVVDEAQPPGDLLGAGHLQALP